MGGGEKDFPEVADYANQLFGEVFEWESGSPGRQDIIGASYLPLMQSSEGWGKLDPALYVVCRDIANESDDKYALDKLISVLEGSIPGKLLERAYNKGKKEGWPAFLYEVLKERTGYCACKGIAKGCRILIGPGRGINTRYPEFRIRTYCFG